jgi:hypothetical protein
MPWPGTATYYFMPCLMAAFIINPKTLTREQRLDACALSSSVA